MKKHHLAKGFIYTVLAGSLWGTLDFIGTKELGPFVFLYFGVIWLWFVGSMHLSRVEWKLVFKTRKTTQYVCEGTGTAVSGRVVAWEGIEPIRATCAACGSECNVAEDFEKLWVVDTHLTQATKL